MSPYLCLSSICPSPLSDYPRLLSPPCLSLSPTPSIPNFPVMHPPSSLYHPSLLYHASIFHPPSSTHHPPSTIHHPQPTTHHPPSLNNPTTQHRIIALKSIWGIKSKKINLEKKNHSSYRNNGTTILGKLLAETL